MSGGQLRAFDDDRTRDLEQCDSGYEHRWGPWGRDFRGRPWRECARCGSTQLETGEIV